MKFDKALEIDTIEEGKMSKLAAAAMLGMSLAAHTPKVHAQEPTQMVQLDKDANIEFERSINQILSTLGGKRFKDGDVYGVKFENGDAFKFSNNCDYIGIQVGNEKHLLPEASARSPMFLISMYKTWKNKK